MIGQRIAHYEVLERIGVGAESNIYKAKDVADGRIVAVKDVVITEPEKEKYLRHIRNEYEILRDLWASRRPGNGAPGFVEVYELITSRWPRREKRSSLVMQYVNGKDLRREKRYPLGQLADFFRQVADALAVIHSRGYVHGDIKPENIIVGPHGAVTLVDFGFSCRAGAHVGRIRGTREYMAPEQVNRGGITPRTDLYNLGATMYHLLTDSHVPTPMPGPGDEGFFLSGEHARARDVRELRPEVPPRFARLVMDCCEKDESLRCPSAERVAAILREVAHEFVGSS